MKYIKTATTMLLIAATLTSCKTGNPGTEPENSETSGSDSLSGNTFNISLSDSGITVNGKPADNDPEKEIYLSNDIVYYESGKDFTYGEGTEKDAHTVQQAESHTVVNITRPGTYSVSGKLSKGQLAIDLGEDAKDDPGAVVTLILDGADITCEVAPAVIFYNVYECSDNDPEKATKNADTSLAGANIIIADDSLNNISGSYVARIYKPGTIELSEDGTKVADAKKLHKYDAAFYSKMSMNINGGTEGTGILNIDAENEGLDSELHLTLNGGNINILSGNDGINTNEDQVSVTTINGGNINIKVLGSTGEGDGIDSNGWLVINGGTVITQACSDSADAGIDSDMGIHINGGTVISSGNMLDRIEDGGQTYAVFEFSQKHSENDPVVLKNEKQETVMSTSFDNAFSVIILSSPELCEGSYTLWDGETQLGFSGGNDMASGPFGKGQKPNPPHMPEGTAPFGEHPDDKAFQRGERPEIPRGAHSQGKGFPDGEERTDNPDKNRFGNSNRSFETDTEEKSVEFVIKEGANYFRRISPVK